MEEHLPGGNTGGAVLVDGTVRRTAGPWTPTIHALLRHLAERGFEGAPRVLGIDTQGREILTYLAGDTVGTARPWPAWVHTDDALVQVGHWLRSYHRAVRDFVPEASAVWRLADHVWRPGDVIGHNDAAPYNAVWLPPGGATQSTRLVGFVDWDFAAPCPPIWDLAFVAFSWVPLHARHVVTPEGFTDFGARRRRLHVLLDAYGYTGSPAAVLDAVTARVVAHARGVRDLARGGDAFFARLVASGVTDDLDRALSELATDPDLQRMRDP